MLRGVILFFLFAEALFAGNSFGAFGDRLPIYTIGDASGVADALNFVAVIVNNDVLSKVFLAGVVVALVRMVGKIMDANAAGTSQEFVYIFVVYIFFLAPTTNVSVVDGRVYSAGVAAPDVNMTNETGYVSYQAVDNIPLGIAVISSASTVASWELASLVDTVISPVGNVEGKYLGITRVGYTTPAKDMRWIVKNMTTGVGGEKSHHEYEYRLMEYVSTCALPTIDLDMRYASYIKSPPNGDYNTYLSPAMLPVAGTIVVDPFTKTPSDCSDFWTNEIQGDRLAFENNLLTQFRNHKAVDAGPIDIDYEAGIRNLMNASMNTQIAGLKDSFAALKRA